MDVLFLSVSTGGGHLKAAEAIKENIEEIYPDSRTMIIDTLRYVNPFVDKLIVGSYLNTVKTTPQIYGKLYEIAENDENICDLSKTVNTLLSFKIRSLITEFRPSVIVCTHPFPLQMVCNLKSKGKIAIPIVAVLTDYVTHPFWLHDSIDAYVVAHDHMKYEMAGREIDENKIHALGIPVSKNFLYRKSKRLLLEELELDNKLTILIMGGSLGFGGIKETFLAMLNCRKDFQIIAVTGKNIKLKNQLEYYSHRSSKKVLVYSYTSKIADLMSISDFIITKPGGMTISEALVKELPMFFISPIPGQEERNAHFVINNGAAARIFDNDKIDSTLCQIIDNPMRINHMKEMARFLARPDAARDTVYLLEKLTADNKAAVNTDNVS